MAHSKVPTLPGAAGRAPTRLDVAVTTIARAKETSKLSKDRVIR